MKRFSFDSNESIDKLFITISQDDGVISTVNPGMRVVGFDRASKNVMDRKEWLDSIIDHICMCYRHRVLIDAELVITVEGNMQTEAHTITQYILKYFPFAQINEPYIYSKANFGEMVVHIAKLVNMDKVRVMNNPVTTCSDIEQRLELRGSEGCQCPACPQLGSMMIMAASNHH